METNIGAKFLALIDRCFPRGSIMAKVFNRNKISYRTCPNMKQILAKHNKKIIANICEPASIFTYAAQPITKKEN